MIRTINQLPKERKIVSFKRTYVFFLATKAIIFSTLCEPEVKLAEVSEVAECGGDTQTTL